MALLDMLMGMGGLAGAQSLGPGTTMPVAPAAAPAAAPAPTGFMGRLGGMLFPAQAGVDPALQQQLQQRALLTLGLGMMAGSRRGLGGSMLGGFQEASSQYDGAMQRAFEHSRLTRAERTDAERRAQDLDWKKTVYAGEQQRQNREAADTAAYRKSMLDLEAKRADIAARQAASGMTDDKAIAELRAAQAAMLRDQQKVTQAIEAKLQAGQPLTQDEKDIYQLVRTGRQPTENPWAALLNGGVGPQIRPDGKGAPVERLVSDPRL